MVSMLAFYSNDLSSNHAVNSFKRRKINEKVAGIGPLKTSVVILDVILLVVRVIYSDLL